jgi:hypothetical protein
MVFLDLIKVMSFQQDTRSDEYMYMSICVRICTLHL